MALPLTSPFLPTPTTTRTTKNKLLSQAPSQMSRCAMRKKGLHPELFEDSKVYCNGELVLTTGGTQREYTVDVWSGNHPYYLGDRSALIVADNQVEKFRKKYGELEHLMKIPVLKHGTIELPERKKAKKGKK